MKKFFDKFSDNEGNEFFELNSFRDDIPVELLLKNKTKNETERRIIIIKKYLLPLLFILLTITLFWRVDFFSGTNKEKTETVNKFHRPDIVDRNGETIATNLPTWDLYVEPYNVVDAEKSAKMLVKVLPYLKYNDVLQKMKSPRKFLYIVRDITPAEQKKIILIGEPGFGFEQNEGRVHTQGSLFSHIIGSVDIDNNGVSGIEKYIDSKGLSKSTKPIQLSVDLYIQDAIHQNLSFAMKEYGAKSAAGIVMDVKTGEILGMVSLPDFKINEYKNTVLNTLYNNHITYDVYEMGSVMKIFNTALAIENSYPNDKFFNVLKPFKIGSHPVKDSHPKKALLNMAEGFIHSSNIVMANIAQDLGIEKQKEFFEKIKMFKKVNFELPERGEPLLPKVWDEFTSASIGYGYSISPTMLHIISAVNGIINDGMYIEPTIMKKDTNSVLKSYQVVSQKTSEAMRKLMRLVVTDGTGYMAKLKDIAVGGKTGTSYKNKNGKYDKNKIRTFFISIFPVDSPKYIMLVMLDEAVTKTGCNSSACTTVPVSTQIIKEIGSILNLDLTLKIKKN